MFVQVWGEGLKTPKACGKPMTKQADGSWTIVLEVK